MNDIFAYDHPFVCTDAVIFSVNTLETDDYRKLSETGLKILLYKRTTEPYQSKWCLPGGFLNIDEMPEDNIRRKIFEKSSVDNCYLEQLFTFCDLNRDPRARVISISYLGLLNEQASKTLSNDTAWFSVSLNEGLSFVGAEDLFTDKDLGFDHYQIIKTAISRLQSKIQYTDIIFNILPEEFTLTQMQKTYEAILGKKELAANFRRKISDMVKETDRFTNNKGHRPAKLYTKNN